MYKLLLAWRYLRTRYLALASIISVMLGVATLIVVNSVMSGFGTKLRERLRGLTADVMVESRSLDGFEHYEAMMQRVKELCGDKVEAVSPTIEFFGMMKFRYRRHGDTITRPVRIIGIDPDTKGAVGDFGRHLLSKANQENPPQCFTVDDELRKKHDDFYASPFPIELPRPALEPAPVTPGGIPPPAPVDWPEEPTLVGAIPGYAIASYRNPNAKPDDPDKDILILQPGDEMTLYSTTRGDLEAHDGSRREMGAAMQTFVVTDLFKCDMSEYDSNMVFIDIKEMQRMRLMDGRATSLQIKLNDYDRDAQTVIDTLRRDHAFPPELFMVHTWEQKQGPMLGAIAVERGILNVLLFLIIAVAGFGILAIFFMIVVEKTRDIGILKSLGASNKGVMGIFLSYGLSLGVVGAGLGTLLGITITFYINEIEQFIAKLTGGEVFPRDIYYFDAIPTDMQTLSVLLVNFGAILIAVAASVFPSLRAAMLHPVRALRWE